MLKLSEFRKEKGLTQVQLADALGMSVKKTAAWEQERAEPCIADICLLADFFGCTTDELLGREQHDGAIDKRKEMRPSTLKLVDATEKLNDMGIAVVLGYVARLIEDNPDFVLPQYRARAQ